MAQWQSICLRNRRLWVRVPSGVCSDQEIPGSNPGQDCLSCWPNGKAPDYGGVTFAAHFLYVCLLAIPFVPQGSVNTQGSFHLARSSIAQTRAQPVWQANEHTKWRSWHSQLTMGPIQYISGLMRPCDQAHGVSCWKWKGTLCQNNDSEKNGGLASWWQSQGVSQTIKLMRSNVYE